MVFIAAPVGNMDEIILYEHYILGLLFLSILIPDYALDKIQGINIIGFD